VTGRAAASRPAEGPHDEERLVAVTMVMGTFAACRHQGRAGGRGIPAMTRGEQHGSWLFAGSGGGLGLVQVLVEAERLDEAKAVLDALEEEEGGAIPGS